MVAGEPFVQCRITYVLSGSVLSPRKKYLLADLPWKFGVQQLGAYTFESCEKHFEIIEMGYCSGL